MSMTYDQPIPNGVAGPFGDRVTRALTLLLRLSMGVFWFLGAGWKDPPDFGETTGKGLYKFTVYGLDHPTIAPWSWIIEHVVLPNFRLFGWITFAVEWSLAIFLLLGLATRFWGLVGAAWSISIGLTVANGPEEWYWTYLLMMLANLALVALAAGRVGGLDARFRPRWTASSSTMSRWLLRSS